MLGRSVLIIAAVIAAAPAIAAELNPEEARHFIAGKHFSYTCFEGTNGAGRINADGSVIGTIQIRGSGPTRFVMMPPGTIRVQADSICASLRGTWFTPCFSVNQIDARSFRGSVSGLGFAYCDFTRHNARVDLTPAPSRPADKDVLRTSISE
jgi:hypothetical protein